jgi:hypothetical protein
LVGVYHARYAILRIGVASGATGGLDDQLCSILRITPVCKHPREGEREIVSGAVPWVIAG